MAERPHDPLPWRTAWIVGASTGIGAAFARRLAAAGVEVVASARSADKLADLARESTRITPLVFDITDGPAVSGAVDAAERRLRMFDLVVLNAGIWQPMGASDFSAAKIRTSLEVNLIGPALVLEALIPRLIAQGRGHLAITASVAGYRGLPKAAAYAPSKAAAIALAEVLRPDLGRHGVTVSVINPGFVDTPMTRDNAFPMPFMISAEAAAEHIDRGLRTGRFEIVFPWRMMLAMKIARLLPYRLFFLAVRRMLGRGEATR